MIIPCRYAVFKWACNEKIQFFIYKHLATVSIIWYIGESCTGLYAALSFRGVEQW